MTTLRSLPQLLLAVIAVLSHPTESMVDTPAPPSPLPARVQTAIIGGGLGGLAACAALRRRGIDAHVFESAGTLLRGSTGTGIMVSPNGMEALGSIDPALPDAMREGGSKIVRQSMRMTGEDGELEKDPVTFDMRSEQVNIGWSRAQEILAGAVDDVGIHCGARFESYESVEGGSAVDITFEDGRVVRTSLLIGCDGAGSAVRQFMANSKFKNEKRAAKTYATRYSGQLLWNAIVPYPSISPPAHAPGEVEFTRCGDDGKVILVFDAGGGSTSWYLTLMENSLPPAATGIRAALAADNIGGFGRAGVKEELRKAFAAWPMAVACLDATPEAAIFERRLSDRPVLKNWTGAGGRAVLMGDAAHPMVPSQGQGTMMTWEDAADLAACVAPALTKDGNGAVPAAVKKYVKMRAKRCTRIQKFSAESYMGRRLPSFAPLKIISMMRRMRTMKYTNNGYKPVAGAEESAGGTGSRKQLLRRLFQK